VTRPSSPERVARLGGAHCATAFAFSSYWVVLLTFGACADVSSERAVEAHRAPARQESVRFAEHAVLNDFGAPVYNPADGHFWVFNTEGYDQVGRTYSGGPVEIVAPIVGGGGGISEQGVVLHGLGRAGWVAFYDCNFAGTWFFFDAEDLARRDLPRGKTPNPFGCEGGQVIGAATDTDGRRLFHHVGTSILKIEPESGAFVVALESAELAKPNQVVELDWDAFESSLLVTLRPPNGPFRLLRFRLDGSEPEEIGGGPQGWTSLAADPQTGLLYFSAGDSEGLVELDPSTGTRLAVALPQGVALTTMAPRSTGDGQTLWGIAPDGDAFRLVEVTDALPYGVRTPVDLDAGGPYSTMEGMPVELVGRGLPDRRLDWSLGDGSRAEGGTVTHTYVDDGRYSVDLRLKGEREPRVATWVTVANAPPNLTIEAPTQVTSGDPVLIRARIEDPGIMDAPWMLRGDWLEVDSTTVRVLDQDRPVMVQATLLAPGPRAIRFRVEDKDGGADAAVWEVTVSPKLIGLVRVQSVAGLDVREEDRADGLSVVAALTDSGFDAARLLVEQVVIEIDAWRGGVSRRADGSIRTPVRDIDGDGDLDVLLFFEPPDDIAAGPISVTGPTADGVVVRGVVGLRKR